MRTLEHGIEDARSWDQWSGLSFFDLSPHVGFDMPKPLEEMTDDEFLQHIQSLPPAPSTLESFPKILAEIRRRNGGRGLTRDDYRSLAEAYADSVVKPRG